MNANQRGFLLAVAFAGCGLAQPLEYTVVKEDILLDRLKLAHTDAAERYNRLKGLFQFSGCRGDSYREQVVKGAKEPNVICTVGSSIMLKKDFTSCPVSMPAIRFAISGAPKPVS